MKRVIRGMGGRTPKQLACAALAMATAACATAPAAPVASQSMQEYCFDGAAPQRATADDIHMFDTYIGRFRGATQQDETSGREFFFTVEYAWFDEGHRTVRYRVALSIVGQQSDRTLSEGFYGYDPFNERVYVLGVFTSGASGFGAVGEFDRAANSRTTWACQIDADGRRIYVRDNMEMIDADSWRNVTRVRQGEDGDWTTITDEVMTRASS